jgi:WhiB family redox-sensing transcriptional regulator
MTINTSINTSIKTIAVTGTAGVRQRIGGTDEPVPCGAESPDLWFSLSPADLELAKRHCHRCPVRVACLASAMERREPWGVWGGEIFDRGVVIPFKRARGRPRKSATSADQAAPHQPWEKS